MDKCSKQRPHVELIFPLGENGDNGDDVEWRWCGLLEEGAGLGVEQEVCLSYANHGHCTAGGDCARSHNIDLIIRYYSIL